MKKDTEDILLSSGQLKKMPFDVPPGYFPSLAEKTTRRVMQAGTQEYGIIRKLVPYFATAAMFAIIATVGTFFLSRTTGENDYSFEDYIVMSDSFSEMFNYAMDSRQYAETAPDEQDIADYLIYTGVSTECIELSYK